MYFAVLSAIILLIFCLYNVLYVSTERKRKEKVDAAQNEANNAAAEAKKYLTSTIFQVRGAEKINVTVKAKKMAEVVASAVKNMDTAATEAEEAASVANMTKSPKIAQEAAVQAKRAANKTKIVAETALNAASQARREENEINEIKKAIEKSKKALESITADVKKVMGTQYITEIAIKSANDVKQAVHNAEKLIIEAEKTAGEAKNSTSLQETQNISQQVKKSAEMALSEVALIKKAVLSAENEESAYNEAISEINEAFTMSKRAAGNSTSASEIAKKAANISLIAKEAAEKADFAYKNSVKFAEEAADCVSKIKTLISAKEAQSVAARIKESAQKAKAQAAAAKNAQETATLIQDAENGNSVAQRQLGLFYLEGTKPFDKDINKAVELLEKAAENNDLDSQIELAYLYCYGKMDLQADIQKGLKWLNKAGDEDKRSSSLLLRLHIDGVIEKDPVDLIKFYENVLNKHKDPLAMIALGEMYCSGQGTRQNPIKGSNYLKEGIKNCKEPLSPNFCLRLGMLYYEGKTNKDGVSSLGGALPFFEKAAVIGDNKFIAFVNEVKEQFKRERLESELRSAEYSLERRKTECIACNKKREESVYTPTLGTYVGKRVNCPHGYGEWIPNGSYQGDSYPGDKSCPKFTDMFTERDRLKKELEALDEAPSLF